MRSIATPVWLVACAAIFLTADSRAANDRRDASTSTGTSARSFRSRAINATGLIRNKRKADLRLDTRDGLFRSTPGLDDRGCGQARSKRAAEPDHRRGQRHSDAPA